MVEEYKLAEEVEQLMLKHTDNMNDLQRLNYLRTIEISASLLHNEITTRRLNTDRVIEVARPRVHWTKHGPTF